MLEGKRPPECDYCWRVEDSHPDSLSDRILKSREPWSKPFLNEISNKHWSEDVFPSYAEVSFGNLCNLKCSYCFPQFSSRIMEEIQQYGGYPTSEDFNNLRHLKKTDQMPIPPNQPNPYVDAFWKWWPELYPNLQYFRLTGGEPLINKNTFQVLEHITAEPNSNLTLGINSNLCIPDDLFEKAIEKFKRILGEGLVKKLELYTSAEAKGPQAEYIRFGMDYQKWLDNIHKLCIQVPQLELTIMSTYNVLSIPSYLAFLKDVLAIKREYTYSANQRTSIYLDTPYLRYPKHQAIFIIQPEILKTIFNQVVFMTENLDGAKFEGKDQRGFYKREVDGLKRIYNVASAELNNPTFDTLTNRRDFVKFIDEYDRRRGTNFLQIFPELTDFYHFCKSL